MKRSVLTFLMVSGLAVTASAENLIPNGDFKKFDPKSGRPEGWMVSRTNEVVEEGPGVTPVLRMTSYYRSQNGTWKGNAGVVIPKIPAGKYKFSMKTKGAAGMIYFFIIPPADSGVKKVTRDSRKNKMKALDDGWKYGEYELDFPKDASKVALVLEGFFANHGEYEYLADLKIEPVK